MDPRRAVHQADVNFMNGTMTAYYESPGLYRRFKKDAEEEIHVAHEEHEEKLRIPSCTWQKGGRENG